MDYETEAKIRDDVRVEIPGRAAPSITVEHLRWRRISWRAIFGGAAVALALQTPLILLGLGIGLINADAISDVTDIALVTWIWWMVAGIVSIFFGAWITGHLVAPASPIDGALNGFVVWSVLTRVMLWMATTAATSIVGGAWSTVTGASRALVEGSARPEEIMVRTQSGREGQRRQSDPAVELSRPQGEQAGGAPQVDVDWRGLGRDLEQFLASVGIDAAGLNLEDEFEDFGDEPIRNAEEFYANVRAWLTDSDPGARQRLEHYLAANTDLTELEAAERLDRWEQQYRETRERVAGAAEDAADAIGEAALWSAAGSLVALLAAGAGGAVGAASASPRRRRRP